MKSWKTKNGYEVSQVLSGRSNSYFISTERLNILVDTGTESVYNKLMKNIGLLKLTKNKIALLILTHTHFDHCQSAYKIKEKEKCEIAMGKNEEEFAKNGYTALPKGTSSITRLISDLGNRIGKKQSGYKAFIPDILVDEEFDLEDCGLNIKLIKTEGHSSGSISVIVDNEIAIVGDTMFGLFKNSIYPPFADNPTEMINSWKKLINTDCNIFLPGHGKEISREILQKEYDKNSRKN
jgi:glyoxylase-like metal-dependent hydrolase (beta-lactamase superfamily II)